MKKRMEGKGFGFGVFLAARGLGREGVEDEVGGLVTW